MGDICTDANIIMACQNSVLSELLAGTTQVKHFQLTLWS